MLGSVQNLSHPQTNGICERFHKTALNEFYRVAFRKKVYRSTDELQADLDAWIKEYNPASQHPSVCGWSSDDLYPRKLADVTGDGRADIVGFSQGGVYVSLSSSAGGAFSQPMLMSSGGDTDLSFASSFSDTVAGMSGQDTLSFTDPSFATGQTPMSGPMADSNASANIALLGNYLASTFASSGDGSDGTSIAASQAADVSQNTLLTQPQHT
jgi:hypothetical protein